MIQGLTLDHGTVLRKFQHIPWKHHLYHISPSHHQAPKWKNEILSTNCWLLTCQAKGSFLQVQAETLLLHLVTGRIFSDLKRCWPTDEEQQVGSGLQKMIPWPTDGSKVNIIVDLVPDWKLKMSWDLQAWKPTTNYCLWSQGPVVCLVACHDCCRHLRSLPRAPLQWKVHRRAAQLAFKLELLGQIFTGSTGPWSQTKNITGWWKIDFDYTYPENSYDVFVCTDFCARLEWVSIPSV